MPAVPALSHLMGAYFHQDWEVDGDEWDVVDLFIRQEPESAAALAADIDEVLAAFPHEAALRAFILNDLGGCYLADADGGSYREWLTRIADRVRAAT